MRQSKIHPSAIIDPAAQIGRDVEIGPYAVIGPQVTLGDNVTVQSHAVIEGSVAIGSGNLIGHGAMIGTAPQDLSFAPERKTKVQIGDDNVIRELCTIHRGSAEGSQTQIGNHNFLMVGAHIGHNCSIGSNVIIANNCLLGGHVRVDDGAFLGGGCLFHQFMRVGRLAIAQGGSAFGKDIPPFVIAAERNYVFGLNVIGLRRAGFSSRERDAIKAAFKLLYTSGLNVSQALAESTKLDLSPPAREFFDFVAEAKQRGVCPYKRGGDEEM
jgi:UDP-N-acetylglucosamine acyltransferase